MPISSSLPQTKKRKTTHLATIEIFEEGLSSALAESGSLNALVDFIQFAATVRDPQEIHKTIYALYRTFVRVVESGRLCASPGEPDEVKAVRSWLNERLADYTRLLCNCLRHEEKSIRTSALQIQFSLLKHLSESFSTAYSQPQLHTFQFRKLVNGLLLVAVEDGRIDPDVRDQFVEKWFSVHDDIRWFFLRESSNILRSTERLKNPSLPENLLSILERLNTMPTESAEINEFWIPSLGRPPSKTTLPPKEGDTSDVEAEAEDDWRTFFDTPDPSKAAPTPSGKGQSQRVYRLSTHESLHSLTSHRAQFSNCWMALLPHLSKSAGLTTRALKVLHRGVMPHLTKPVRLMDWIGGCVDFGGSVGLLALNALFVLMQEYNLDYPNFYTRLYAFLTRDVLHLKHRARFFRLTERFLSSTHLPAVLVASFIKRLSRLSISAPPAAIIMVIPFTYNMLKRHPACMVMIHHEAEGFESDPFDPKEDSPYLTNALSSSLWELVSHRNHYHAPVATLARVFFEPFTRPEYAMEDFLDHTYATLFDTEAKHKIKKDPPLTFQLKSELFPQEAERALDTDSGEEVARMEADVVSELWNF